jgi:tetratricopeptide (TPR) repeat protein
LDALLKSDYARKAIQDPTVAEWVLRKIEDKKGTSAPNLTELERFLFDDVTIRRLLDHGQSETLTRMFRTLSPECFRDATALLLDRWPTWQDTVACWSAPVIAKMAPAEAIELFRAYAGGQSIWEDFNKTAGVCKAVRLLRSEASQALAQQLIERMTDGNDELARRFAISESVHLAWTQGLPVLEELLIDLVTAPEKVALAEHVLDSIHHTLTDGMPFFEHAMDLQDGNTEQSFASLSLLFDAGAPLEELDRLTTGVEEISIGDAFVFVSVRCKKRDYRPLDVVCSFMMNRKEPVQGRLKPLVGRLFLGIGAASWLRSTQDYADLSFEDCVHLAASDLRTLPGYDGLLARLRECRADEVVRLVTGQLPKVQNHYGAIHLLRLMGDLGHDAFVPLLLDCLSEGRRDFVLTEAVKALSRLGPRAERALLESWGQLDASQRMHGFDVLAHVGAEASVAHLVQCFPEMRNEQLETWCETGKAVPGVRLLDVLEPELKRMHPLIDETFFLISTLLGQNNEQLAAVHKRVTRRRREQEEQRLAPWPEGTGSTTLPMELKCRACGDLNRYEVRSVFIAPDAPKDKPYVADELTCHSCGAFDCLEVSDTGYLPLMAELMRVTSAEKTGSAVNSPLKLVTGKLADGRLVSVGHAIEHYAEAIREEPDSLVNTLSLANCYAGVGRKRQAEAWYRECLRIDPSSAEAAYALAEILEGTGKGEEAFRVLDGALQHKKRWHFHRLTDTTPQEFSEAFAELYNAVSPRKDTGSRAMLHPSFLDTPKKANKREKTSRNAPCPCGSGKKYKKCCGRMAT